VAESKGAEPADKNLTLRRARWHRHLGELLFHTGRSQDSLMESSRCLDLLRLPLGQSKGGMLAVLARQSAAQAAHLAFPGRFVERDPHRRASFAEAAEAAGQYAWTVLGQGKALPLLGASLAAVNWAQKAERQSIISLGVAGSTLASFRLKGLANRSFALGRAKAIESKQYQKLGWLAAMEAQNLVANGKLAECEKMLLDSYPLVESSGDREAICVVFCSLSILAHLFGRYDEARSWSLSAQEALGNVRFHGTPYAHFLVAQAEFSRLSPNEARPIVEERRRKALESNAQDDRIPFYFAFLEAALLTRLKDWATVTMAIDRAIAYGIPMVVSPSWSPVFLMEACTGFWEHLATTKDGQAKEVARKTERVLRSFRFYAWMHPLHRGTYLLVCGQVAWLKGKQDKAMKLWRQSLEATERLSRSFENGVCHYEIGRRSPISSADRRSHLETARSIFARCQSAYYLERVDSLLSQDSGASS
jgi:hypothetical protein